MKGEFTVNAPYIMEQWPSDKDFKLTLSPSRATGKHLWGNFDFGVIKGVIRCGLPPTTTGDTIHFKWRGYAQDKGKIRMQFDDKNKGTLTFLGNGRIRGTMDGSSEGEFILSCIQNTQSLDHIVWAKRVKAWKAEWRAINELSHTSVCVADWHGWGGWRNYTERPADSDTSDRGISTDEGEIQDRIDAMFNTV